MAHASSARVQGVTLKVEDILQRLKDGVIRVPPFQRGLKWKKEDNKLFFDSLLKSYPVGSMLMWVRDSLAARLELGPFHLDVQGRSGAWQVVDGQQRLTALAAALLPTQHRDINYDFVVDLETADVVPARNRPPPKWVPLDVLADIEKLLHFLHAHPDVDVTKASALSKRLREYPISASILETDEQAFVEDVFKRLNTAGKRLTANEVFRASRANQQGSSAIDRAVQVGTEFQFGALDESNVLRAFKALSGRDPLADEAFVDNGAGDALVRGAAEAVNFLKHIGVPIVELLPYSLLSGVLLAFFGKHRDVLPRNRQLLGYWFWRATFTFRMAGDFSVIRRLFALATTEDQSEAVQSLLADIGSEMRLPAFEPPPSLRSAEGRILALELIGLGPRHLETGAPIDVGALLWVKKTKAFLQLPAVPRSAGLFTAIIHPQLPSDRLAAALAAAPAAVLKSHALIAPFESKSQDYWVKRERSLNDLINEFMSEKRGGSDSLRPPLSALGDAT